ncbi:hypothetical protein lerEdw1_014579 [Lerista edwardsae]|nr:hypothetical protein lerEdw1_014580 [Lerista edwardsae]KAJ6632963.1 hypothetical protein lerEdw1_014579 [Lerista edwardsae]
MFGRCTVDDRVTRVAWLNRSTILYAGNDKWSIDDRVVILTNTKTQYSIKIHNVDIYDEGPYTCSVQTDNHPKTSRVHLIVQGKPLLQLHSGLSRVSLDMPRRELSTSPESWRLWHYPTWVRSKSRGGRLDCRNQAEIEFQTRAMEIKMARGRRYGQNQAEVTFQGSNRGSEGLIA